MRELPVLHQELLREYHQPWKINTAPGHTGQEKVLFNFYASSGWVILPLLILPFSPVHSLVCILTLPSKLFFQLLFQSCHFRLEDFSPGCSFIHGMCFPVAHCGVSQRLSVKCLRCCDRQAGLPSRTLASGPGSAPWIQTSYLNNFSPTRTSIYDTTYVSNNWTESDFCLRGSSPALQ